MIHTILRIARCHLCLLYSLQRARRESSGRLRYRKILQSISTTHRAVFVAVRNARRAVGNAQAQFSLLQPALSSTLHNTPGARQINASLIVEGVPRRGHKTRPKCIFKHCQAFFPGERERE